ncbi:MAG TPA: hypothetical protein VGS57_10075 [Thermoanaerobaculia bacterium]|jgi:hypothetical protein|nr:hypothetical protein [Thermoanaerobaculia bacterium]
MSTTLAAATASHNASLASSQAAALVGELMRHLLSRAAEASPALLTRLDEAVRTYEVKFRGYLNGQGQRPPLELGGVLATAFLELAAAGSPRDASRFRVEALEARFHAGERLLNQRLERGERRLPARLGRSA